MISCNACRSIPDIRFVGRAYYVSALAMHLNWLANELLIWFQNCFGRNYKHVPCLESQLRKIFGHHKDAKCWCICRRERLCYLGMARMIYIGFKNDDSIINSYVHLIGRNQKHKRLDDVSTRVFAFLCHGKRRMAADEKTRIKLSYVVINERLGLPSQNNRRVTRLFRLFRLPIMRSFGRVIWRMVRL